MKSMKMPKKFKKPNKKEIIIGAFLFVAIIGSAFSYDFIKYLDLETLREHKEILLSFAETNPLFLMTTLFIAYTSMAAVFVPGTLFFAMLVGFIFGFWKSVFLISLAFTVGSLFAFLFFKVALRKFVIDIIPDRYFYILEEVYLNPMQYLFAMRMMPFLPFIIPNFIMSLTDIKTREYVIVSYVGMLPYAMFSANAGIQLAKVDKLQDLISVKILLSFVAIGFFPLLAKKILKLTNLIKDTKLKLQKRHLLINNEEDL